MERVNPPALPELPTEDTGITSVAVKPSRSTRSMINDVVRDASPLSSWMFWCGKTSARSSPDQTTSLTLYSELAAAVVTTTLAIPQTQSEKGASGRQRAVGKTDGGLPDGDHPTGRVPTAEVRAGAEKPGTGGSNIKSIGTRSWISWVHRSRISAAESTPFGQGELSLIISKDGRGAFG
jgi:hypothetical protein